MSIPTDVASSLAVAARVFKPFVDQELTVTLAPSTSGQAPPSHVTLPSSSHVGAGNANANIHTAIAPDEEPAGSEGGMNVVETTSSQDDRANIVDASPASTGYNVTGAASLSSPPSVRSQAAPILESAGMAFATQTSGRSESRRRHHGLATPSTRATHLTGSFNNSQLQRNEGIGDLDASPASNLAAIKASPRRQIGSAAREAAQVARSVGNNAIIASTSLADSALARSASRAPFGDQNGSGASITALAPSPRPTHQMLDAEVGGRGTMVLAGSYAGELRALPTANGTAAGVASTSLLSAGDQARGRASPTHSPANRPTIRNREAIGSSRAGLYALRPRRRSSNTTVMDGNATATSNSAHSSNSSAQSAGHAPALHHANASPATTASGQMGHVATFPNGAAATTAHGADTGLAATGSGDAAAPTLASSAIANNANTDATTPSTSATSVEQPPTGGGNNDAPTALGHGDASSGTASVDVAAIGAAAALSFGVPILVPHDNASALPPHTTLSARTVSRMAPLNEVGNQPIQSSMETGMTSNAYPRPRPRPRHTIAATVSRPHPRPTIAATASHANVVRGRTSSSRALRDAYMLGMLDNGFANSSTGSYGLLGGLGGSHRRTSRSRFPTGRDRNTRTSAFEQIESPAGEFAQTLLRSLFAVAVEFNEMTSRPEPIRLHNRRSRAGPSRINDTLNRAGPSRTVTTPDRAGLGRAVTTLNRAGLSRTSDTLNRAGPSRTSDTLNRAGPSRTANTITALARASAGPRLNDDATHSPVASNGASRRRAREESDSSGNDRGRSRQRISRGQFHQEHEDDDSSIDHGMLSSERGTSVWPRSPRVSQTPADRRRVGLGSEDDIIERRNSRGMGGVGGVGGEGGSA